MSLCTDFGLTSLRGRQLSAVFQGTRVQALVIQVAGYRAPYSRQASRIKRPHPDRVKRIVIDARLPFAQVELKTREAGLRTSSTISRFFTTGVPILEVIAADTRHEFSIIRNTLLTRFHA